MPVTTYITIRSNVATNKIIISELNEQYEKLKMENDATVHELNSKVNLNDAYDRAVNNLGMKRLTVDKIKYYKTNVDDYFKQNHNLTK